MRLLLRWVLLGSLATVIGPSGVYAQPAPKVDKVKANAAKRYVDAGLAAQGAGDYDTAITFYQKAYKLLPHPVLWFNMAQAHRLAGRADEALKFYARYLAMDGDGSQAKTARLLVADLETRKAEEARIAQQQRDAEVAFEAEGARKAAAAGNAEAARKAEPARKAEAARKAEESRRAAGEQAHQAEASSTTVLEREATPRSTVTGNMTAPELWPGRKLRVLGLGTGAIGVVTMGVGVGFGLRASSLSDDLSKRGATYDPAKVDAGQTANRVAIVGLVGGTVALAVGATLYWRGHARAKTMEQVTLRPMASDSLAGFVVSGVWP